MLVLPLREPVLLAKQLATLERLAPGRVILGAGVGWDRDEFAALEVPFTERGRRTDELIELVAHLHTTGSGGFDGRFHRVGGGVLAPRPSAPIPLLVGGKSDAALKRAARVGDRGRPTTSRPTSSVRCTRVCGSSRSGRAVRPGGRSTSAAGHGLGRGARSVARRRRRAPRDPFRTARHRRGAPHRRRER